MDPLTTHLLVAAASAAVVWAAHRLAPSLFGLQPVDPAKIPQLPSLPTPPATAPAWWQRLVAVEQRVASAEAAILAAMQQQQTPAPPK